MPRDYDDYLNDIINATLKIEAFTEGMTLKKMLGE